jgi:prophage regulatory protein
MSTNDNSRCLEGSENCTPERDGSDGLIVANRRRRRRADRRLDQLTPASIVNMADVLVLTTLSRATIYRKMKADTFPSNRNLSTNRSGWRYAEILAWLENPR